MSDKLLIVCTICKEVLDHFDNIIKIVNDEIEGFEYYQIIRKADHMREYLKSIQKAKDEWKVCKEYGKK